MQHQILINVIIFVAYVLNLLLNTQRSHSRSQRAGKWSLILAHYRRPIYRAPTYIAVPLLGPHQPRYIGLTLYQSHTLFISNCPRTGMFCVVCLNQEPQLIWRLGTCKFHLPWPILKWVTTTYHESFRLVAVAMATKWHAHYGSLTPTHHISYSAVWL